MNRSSLRTVLRRQIQDVPAVQWSDAELNDVLDLTYSLIQKEIIKSFPDAHLFWDNINTVAGTSWYPLPQTFGVASVGIKSDASDTAFTPLSRKRYADILTLTTTSKFYSRRGQWIGIFPAPTTSVANGLEIVHTPIMSMSADSDVPRIKTPLHMGIIYWSKLLLLGETDEAAGETVARLKEILGDIPSWYETHTDEPDMLSVQR